MGVLIYIKQVFSYTIRLVS